ncbi:MAG: hypothetical protein JKY19_12555 [Alcanivoracaceae bacterium]|nr:hypothetical protein [Alcanivoracaceae bacterium]
MLGLAYSILGNFDSKDDQDLARMLQQSDIDERIAQLSNSFELYSRSVKPIQTTSELKSSLFASITASDTHNLLGFKHRLCDFFQLSTKKIQSILNSINKLSRPIWENIY